MNKIQLNPKGDPMRVIPPIKAVINFEAAARLQSFKLAAEELCVTPGAVSHQISTLEEFIGQKLFQRQNRSIKLTNAGLRYYERTSSILNDLEQATTDLGRIHKQKQLKMALPPALLNKWLLPKFHLIANELEGVNVTFIDTLDYLDLQRDEIDISIRYGFEKPDGLYSDLLFKEDMIAVCAPHYHEQHFDKLSQSFLESSTLIYTTNRLVQWDLVLHHYGMKPLKWQRKLIFQNSIQAIDAAVLGCGVAFINRRLVEELLVQGQLVEAIQVNIDPDKVPSYYLVSSYENMQDENIAKFYQLLKKLCE